jgi:hypothetical protein
MKSNTSSKRYQDQTKSEDKKICGSLRPNKFTHHKRVAGNNISHTTDSPIRAIAAPKMLRGYSPHVKLNSPANAASPKSMFSPTKGNPVSMRMLCSDVDKKRSLLINKKCAA